MTDLVVAPGNPPQLLETVAEYWMKARIDAPLAAVERMDQNAKQLIALAAGLQGLLTTVVKVAKIHDPVLLGFAVFAFVWLAFAIIFCAAVLYAQMKYLGMVSIVELLRSPRDGMVQVLAGQMAVMCEAVDCTLEAKRAKLRIAMGCFVGSMAGGLACLVYVMLNGQN